MAQQILLERCHDVLGNVYKILAENCDHFIPLFGPLGYLIAHQEFGFKHSSKSFLFLVAWNVILLSKELVLPKFFAATIRAVFLRLRWIKLR